MFRPTVHSKYNVYAGDVVVRFVFPSKMVLKKKGIDSGFRDWDSIPDSSLWMPVGCRGGVCVF